jgi:acyl-CoA synthetase (AMP-forming)/AMP-acid ligase II
VTGLGTRISRSASWYANDIAIVDGDRHLTFQQADERINRLANVLYGLNPTVGSRVALLLPNSAEFVESDLAIAKAAKCKVPINQRLTPSEREYLLQNSAADILITDLPGLESVDDRRHQLPNLAHVLVVGNQTTPERGYEDALGEASSRPPGVECDPGTPSVILYTSGTTGQPKGATWSFASRYAATLNMLVDELNISPGDAMVHAGSMAHGSGSKCLAFWLRGARNIAMRKFDPQSFLDLIEAERATNSFLVPTMIGLLIEARQSNQANLSTLKTISYGGAPIAPSLLEHALDTFGHVLVQVYGSSEAPHPVTVLSKDDHRDLSGGRAASIGRESVGVELKLADQMGTAVDPGQPGELWITGPSVMTGYWQNPAATSEVLFDGYYRSGDVAVRDERGYYSIIDRQRDMIISGGLNIYPAEVEAVLMGHPGVTEAAVVGVPDDRWGERVMAFVVPRAGGTPTEAELIDYCRARMAGYKKPSDVQFRDALPHGSTGKVLKRELREPFWQGRSRSV